MKGIKVLMLVVALLLGVAAEQQSKAEAFQETMQVEGLRSSPELQVQPVADLSLQVVCQMPAAWQIQQVSSSQSGQMEILMAMPTAAEPWTKIPSYPDVECKEREAYIRESTHPPFPAAMIVNTTNLRYHGIHTRK